jgi:hypothetical protein
LLITASACFRRVQESRKLVAGVRFAQGYILGRLRHQTFFSLADAILDRVIHNAYRIDLAGESMRKRRMLEPSA